MPIETAPRDGTSVDVWTKNGERWTDVRFRNDKWVQWWLDDFGSMGWIRVPNPTHWLAIPSPPKGE